MEQALERALRRGVIPLCCSGATACFTIYAIKVSRAAQEWKDLDAKTHDAQFLRQAIVLQHHAGTCVALALTSAVATGEAVMDWQGYRGLRTLDQMEAWLYKRPLPFLLRPLVMVTGAMSILGVKYFTGGICFFQPRQPLIITRSTHQDSSTE